MNNKAPTPPGKGLMAVNGGKVQALTREQVVREAEEERRTLFEAGRKAGREEATHAKPYRFAAAVGLAVLAGVVLGLGLAVATYERGVYTAGAVIGRVGVPQETPDPSIFDVEEDGTRTPRDGRADQGWAKQRGGWKQGD